MKASQNDPQQNLKAHVADPNEISVDFGKSVIRLTWREWIVVALVLVVFFVFSPKVCELCENSPPALDDRIPFSASEDYWTYRRRMEGIVAAERIPVIGDSVIWGEYVFADQSLAACLNAESASPRFANAGLNGIHPLALEGLLDNYASALRNRRVVLHCNLLWMSSSDRDLQSTKDVSINHAKLIPQFFPSVPAYSASLSQRLGIVMERQVPFFSCVSHLRLRFFDGKDLQSWSIANPYANPLRQFRKGPPADDDEVRHASVPWTQAGIPPRNLPWIDLGSSLQWQAWQRAVLKLRSNGNQVLALVGPFNEHLLLPRSRVRYHSVRHDVEKWLEGHHIPYIAPETLPSDDYGDASHPLSSGYLRLAKSISADAVFRQWCDN